MFNFLSKRKITILTIIIIFILLLFNSYQLKNFQIFIFSLSIFSIILFFIKRINKNLTLIIFSLFFSLSLIEASLYFINNKQSVKKSNIISNQNINIKNKSTILGFQPLEGIQNHRVFKNNQLVFDKFYTIQSNNYRFTPKINDKKKIRKINFFGGSNTFGLGLGDYETLPYLSQKYFLDWEINNYAVSGYGAHQAYTQIKEFENLIGDINIFVTFKNHIPRSSCKRDFSLGTPKYILINDKEIIRDGYCGLISIGKLKIPEIFYKIIKKSQIKIYLDKIYFRKNLFNKKDRDLYLALINQMNLNIKNKGNIFIVGYINEYESLDEKIINYFIEQNIEYVDIGLDNNEENKIQNDGHPSKIANIKRSLIISKKIKNLLN